MKKLICLSFIFAIIGCTSVSNTVVSAGTISNSTIMAGMDFSIKEPTKTTPMLLSSTINDKKCFILTEAKPDFAIERITVKVLNVTCNNITIPVQGYVVGADGMVGIKVAVNKDIVEILPNTKVSVINTQSFVLK